MESNLEASEKINLTYFKTPLGELMLGSFKGVLCLCDWRYRKMRATIDNRVQKELKTVYKTGEDAIIAETKKQLTEYFSGNRKEFSIEMLWVGSDFQKQVWKSLTQIPYGTTRSYLALSKMIDNPKAIRAVAAANGANAFSILVPCHRVIASNGDLTGYAGGLSVKKKLLRLEGALPNNQLQLFS